MHSRNFLFKNFDELIGLRLVDFTNPERVQDLKQEEITQVGLLTHLLLSEYSLPNQSFLERFLNNEVLRNFPEQISEVPLFGHVVLQIDKETQVFRIRDDLEL